MNQAVQFAFYKEHLCCHVDDETPEEGGMGWRHSRRLEGDISNLGNHRGSLDEDLDELEQGES